MSDQPPVPPVPPEGGPAQPGGAPQWSTHPASAPGSAPTSAAASDPLGRVLRAVPGRDWLAAVLAAVGGWVAAYVVAALSLLLTVLVLAAGGDSSGSSSGLDSSGGLGTSGGTGAPDVQSLVSGVSVLLGAPAQLVVLADLGRLHLSGSAGLFGVSGEASVGFVPALVLAAQVVLAVVLTRRIRTRATGFVGLLVPALLSGVVLTAVTTVTGLALAIRFPDVPGVSIDPVHGVGVGSVLGSFVIGTLSVLLARPSALVRGVHLGRALGTARVAATQFGVLLAVVFLVVVVGALVAQPSWGSALPLFVGNAAVAITALGFLGGIGSSGLGAGGTATAFGGTTGLVWLVVLLVLVTAFVAGLALAVRRNDRVRTTLDWVVTPAVWLLAGIVLLVLGTAVVSYSASGTSVVGGAGSLGVTPWTPLVTALWGAAIEVVARFVAPVCCCRGSAAACSSAPLASWGPTGGRRWPVSPSELPVLPASPVLPRDGGRLPRCRRRRSGVVGSGRDRAVGRRPGSGRPERRRPGSGRRVGTGRHLGRGCPGRPAGARRCRTVVRHARPAARRRRAAVPRRRRSRSGPDVAEGPQGPRAFPHRGWRRGGPRDRRRRHDVGPQGQRLGAGTHRACLRRGHRPRDAAAAERLSEVPGDAPMLDSAVLRSASDRPADVRVGRVSASGDNALATVSYSQGGKQRSGQVTLRRTGTAFLVKDEWRVTEPLAETVSVTASSALEGASVSIGGKRVGSIQDGSFRSLAYPGTYEVTVGGDDYFTGGKKQLSVGSSTASSYVDFAPKATDKLKQDAEQFVTDLIEDCAAKTEVRALDGCPWYGPYDADGPVKYSVKTMPKLKVDASLSGSVLVESTSDGVIGYDYTSFFGDSGHAEDTFDVNEYLKVEDGKLVSAY